MKSTTLGLIRYGLFATGGLMAALTVAFFLRMPTGGGLMAMAGVETLLYVFLASITASVAAASIWTAVSQEYAALRSQATNTVVTTAGAAVTAFTLARSGGGLDTFLFGVACAVLCLGGVGTFLVIRRYPFNDRRVLPKPLRISFVFFTLVLIVVGGSMVLGAQIFPWTLRTGSLAVYGWNLGASTYFLYPVLQPSWHNATAQLWGFLAYDLVLILPYLLHFERVAPERLPNLIVYVAVLVYSSALAVYYLFVNPATRSATARSGAARPA